LKNSKNRRVPGLCPQTSSSWRIYPQTPTSDNWGFCLQIFIGLRKLGAEQTPALAHYKFLATHLWARN